MISFISSLSPGGQSIEYQWTGNRITAITSNGQPVISQISYEPDGQANGWTWGNNQQNERFYDLAGRNIIVSMGFDEKTQVPDSRYYGYDAAGRQTSAIDDADPSLNQQHQYDQLDRLTASQRGEPQLSRTDYNYDLSGNRTEKIKDNTTLHSYSTDPNSNRLQSQSGAQTVSYSYDPAGNLTGDGIYSHSYNAAGRRIATTNTTTGQTTQYSYDALDQRISKTNAGTTSQYFYDEQGHLTGEYDATGQLIQETLWLGDLPVAVLKPATPANPTATADSYYIHADHLGTPRKITRPNDNRVVWSWESEAFGNSLPDQNPSGLGSFVFNLRFPGQYYDQETGLFYNYFRDYDPAKGRYIESDPIGLAGGINTYGYVGGNPLKFIDSSGLDVTITINRTGYTKNSISGTIDVISTVTKTTYSGHTLENRNPPNPNLPVPPGTYPASVRSGHTPNRVELIGVPNAANVQIHNGNSPRHVIGCFAVGNTSSTDFVGNSVSAMNSINNIIKQDGTGNITVIVNGSGARP